VSGEAYVGGKITMENNVNNKRFYMNQRFQLSRPINRRKLLRFGVNGGTLLSSSYKQFHKFYCGSTLNLEVGNQTLYMSGSINGLYIEGARHNSTERDYRL
jgi:uncharacterized protein YigE (DUF2233 family)